MARSGHGAGGTAMSSVDGGVGWAMSGVGHGTRSGPQAAARNRTADRTYFKWHLANRGSKPYIAKVRDPAYVSAQTLFTASSTGIVDDIAFSLAKRSLAGPGSTP